MFAVLLRGIGVRMRVRCRDDSGLVPGFRLTLAVLAALTVVTSAAVPGAAAAQRPVPQVRRTADVAGPSVFQGRRCNVATDYYTSPGGKEGEPYVAVNPRHPRNRIVAYMDATRATVDVAYTRSAGQHWRHSIPRGVDGCTGNHTNRWEASGDPWVSIGPDGTAYLSALTWAHFVAPPTRNYTSLVHVQVSRNGGKSWSRPSYVAGHHAVSDKPMVLADPHRAGVAYLIWRNQGFGLATGKRARTRLLFAVTHDGGRRWSQPIVIARGSSSAFFGSPQISLLRGGTLVATSSLASARGGTDLLSWRSTDGGHRWSGPRLITHMPTGGNPKFCGQAAAGGDTASSSGQQTVVRGRTVVLVFLDGKAASAGHGRLVMAKSPDGGRTWRVHTVVRSRDPLLLASVTATGRGQLGLIWDRVDTAHIRCHAKRIPTQTRFIASGPGGSSWTRSVRIGPRWWNLASSARGTGGFSGYFVGDYQAIAAKPHGFVTVGVQGPSLTSRRPRITGATGVIAAVVRLP